jgi:two-component system response regulator HydG
MSGPENDGASGSKGQDDALRIAIDGISPSMQRLRDAIRRVAPHPSAVLLTGETGTGKGRGARALHEASPRRTKPFVHVDCAGLVDGLLESELYGVATGAFTGAQRCRAGRFEAAKDGTLFLDEIGELSPSGQLKLLRVLEEGVFERIGETRPRQLRARVVAATHVDLEDAMAVGHFRADLFFRLRVLCLYVPPLRDRREDLSIWIERAGMHAAERLGCDPPRFAKAADARLRAHEWPGNLRELFHVVEAAAILTETGPVEERTLDGLLRPLRGRYGSTPRTGDSTNRAAQKRNEEREVERAAGNLSLAARRLGVPRSTLRYRLGLDDAISRGRRLRGARSIRGESRPE